MSAYKYARPKNNFNVHKYKNVKIFQLNNLRKKNQLIRASPHHVDLILYADRLTIHHHALV